MAVSKSEIVNRALTLLGAAPITNLDTDDSKNARIMNRVYDTSLRQILSECKWNFATKRKLLATLTSASDPDWFYSGESVVYQLPSDVVRIFGTNDKNASWRIEGETIVSNTSNLGIIYVYLLTDPSKYSAKFVSAFSDLLAADIAYMILNSTSKGNAMLEKYEQISLVNATAENSQGGTQQEVIDDEWELAKYGNSAGSTNYYY